MIRTSGADAIIARGNRLRLRSDFFCLRLRSGAATSRTWSPCCAAVVRRSRAIFVKVDRLDGTADLYGPATTESRRRDSSGERLFTRLLEAAPSPDVEAKMGREIRFDPDLWLIEIEDRAGRAFIDTIG